MSNNTKDNAIVAEVSAIVAETNATLKSLDSYFTIEHQGMIAAKYRTKYSDADQQEHKAKWPEFTGNHFTMYVLAETLSEARKAVFSANKKIFLNNLTGAMVNYTPTTPGAVITELQTQFNKTTDLQLQGLYELIADESQRVELLKDYAKLLKLMSKSGRDTDVNKAKFFHASATLGVTPNTIW
jgi:hypothetical protein